MVPMLMAGGEAVLGKLLNAHPLDAERFQRNEAAYRRAVAGDTNAMLFLKQRSGKFGIAFVGACGDKDTPGQIGAWGHGPPCDDAYQKYVAISGSGPAASSAATPATQAPTTTTGKVLDSISTFIGKATAPAVAAGSTSAGAAAGTAAAQNLKTPLVVVGVLLAVAVVGAAYLISRK